MRGGDAVPSDGHAGRAARFIRTTASLGGGLLLTLHEGHQRSDLANVDPVVVHLEETEDE